MTRLGRLLTLHILLLLFFSAAVELKADVIVFQNGSVLIVTKAWIEDEEVKYQTSRGVQSLPRAQVREIQAEGPLSRPGPQRWGLGVVVGSSTTSSPNTPTASADLSNGALARLRANLSVNPADARAKRELIAALNSVASLQLTQGDLPGALVSLDEAVNLDRRNLVIQSNLGILHLRMGNYRAAQEVFEVCLNLDRNNQDIHYLLGEAYYGQEMISQAIDQWTAGLRLGPHREMSRSLDKAQQEARVHKELDTLQSAHFILRYDRSVSDQLLGRQILGTLEKLYSQLTNELSSRPPATIAVILYPDQAYFDITRVASWSGALFDGKIRVPTKGLTSVTPELTSILIHELTHSFIAGLPGRDCPTWFNEGVAQLQEGESAAKNRKALALLRQANQLIPLEKLEGTFVNLPAAVAEVAYTESLSVVEHIVSQHGKASIRGILDLMAQNYNFDNAFKTVLQKSVSELEAGWRLDLTR